MKQWFMLSIAAVFSLQSFAFQLHSDSFQPFGLLSKQAVCPDQGGGSISPQLAWSDLPKGTRSLLLFVHDPDAPLPAGFAHWVAYINNPTITALASGISETPHGEVVFGLNGANANQYFGACPPKNTGVHRYNFILYALNTQLNPTLVKSLHQRDLIDRFAFHIIGQAILTGYYQYQR